MAIIGMLVGGLVVALFGGRFDSIVAGAIVGLVAGLIVNERRKSKALPRPGAVPGGTGVTSAATAAADARIAALEQRVADVEAALARAGLPIAQAAPGVSGLAVAPPLDGATAQPGAAPSYIASRRDARDSSAATIARGDPAPRASIANATADGHVDAADVAAAPLAPPDRVPTPRAPNAIWSWIVGGNTFARIGLLVLFIGVGFLLKYAAEHVTVPIGFRIAGVALGGIALLVAGWVLRHRRHAYAMILQGGGVGVLYLVVFAAFKLYALLPAPAAFAMLVAIAALSAVLAIRQDAIALAVAGIVGGFLAPILASNQTGSHVVLFTYYALLNAGIFAIAWFKAWRPLNLLGFAFTFVVGAAWGVTRYRAADFATTEPFLILFFLFYVGIAVLYAWRQSVEVRRYVDGTLVFGTPLCAAALQQPLMRPFEFGMALSAVAASALYLVLARVLWSRRRDDLRLLVESFLALGVVFATLAVPLALDVRLTSAGWALEGAAIAWVGIRQDRVVARWFGVFLQFAAGVALAIHVTFGGAHPPTVLPLLNSECVGALLVALAGLATAWMYQRHATSLRATERSVTPAIFVWGVVWWLAAGANEIGRFVAAPRQDAALVTFLTLTAVAFALASRRLAWPMARAPALWLGPVLLVCALFGVSASSAVDGAPHLFAHLGFIAWPFAIAADIWLLHRFERGGDYSTESATLRYAHAAWLWVVTLVAASELAWLVANPLDMQGAWPLLPWGVVPAIALAAACSRALQASWPVASNRRAYLVAGAVPLALWMLAWIIGTGVAGDGNPAPLPYIPIANPVDLGVGFAAVTLVAWSRALARDGIDIGGKAPRGAVVGCCAVVPFLWINAIALRTIHHWIGIDWSLDAMWRSTLVQAVLSLLWTLTALATMAVAHRREARNGWIAGAALLAVVVVKLFVIDLSRIGSIERIVSFIGVGLLLLLIGYVAPVPPRKKETP